MSTLFARTNSRVFQTPSSGLFDRGRAYVRLGLSVGLLGVRLVPFPFFLLWKGKPFHSALGEKEKKCFAGCDVCWCSEVIGIATSYEKYI